LSSSNGRGAPVRSTVCRVCNARAGGRAGAQLPCSGKLRVEAKRSKDGGQARRLLALAAIYEGTKRFEAARIGGVTLQIARDWVMKFNAKGPTGLIDRKAVPTVNSI
jgi:hypothetical protein